MSGDPTIEAGRPRRPEESRPDPAARVLGWRIEQLIAVGFDSDAAFVLALDRSVDLHQATELVAARLPAADGVPHPRLIRGSRSPRRVPTGRAGASTRAAAPQPQRAGAERDAEQDQRQPDQRRGGDPLVEDECPVDEREARA